VGGSVPGGAAHVFGDGADGNHSSGCSLGAAVFGEGLFKDGVCAGWIAYELDPAPKWLSFDPSTSTLSGTPDDGATLTYTGIKLTMKSTADPSAAAEVFQFTLPVVAGPDVVIPASAHVKAPQPKSEAATGKGTVAPAAASGEAAAQSTLRVPPISLNAELTTATTEIDGRAGLLPTPAAPDAGAAATAPPKNFARIGAVRLDAGTGARSLLRPVGSGTDGTVAIQGDGSFQMTLASSLPAGTKVEFFAAPPDKYSFGAANEGADELERLGERRIRSVGVNQATIPLPRVTVPGSLTAGQTRISGQLDLETMPGSPTAATAADGKSGAAASAGNLPSIAVEIYDPANGVFEARSTHDCGFFQYCFCGAGGHGRIIYGESADAVGSGAGRSPDRDSCARICVLRGSGGLQAGREGGDIGAWFG